MKIRLFIVFLLISSLIGSVFAQSSDSKEQIEVVRETGGEITQAKNTKEFAKGEDITAYLPMYSKTYIRIYENTKVDFYVTDPDTNAILIENSLVVKDVNDEGVIALLSTDNSEFKEVLMDLGKEFKIEYKYSFMPYIVITPTIINPNEGSTALFFLVPFLKTSQTDFSQVKSKSVDLSKISATNTEKDKEEIISETGKVNPKIIALIFGIVLVCAILIALILKKKIKKVKQR